MKRTIALSFILMMSALFLDVTACNHSSSSPEPAVPTVASTSPASGATGIASNAAITVTFSEPMDPATIDSTTFTVMDSGGNKTSGSVSCSGTTATFTPTSSLTYLVKYTATMTTGAKSQAGKALAADYTWSFTVDTTPSPLLSAATLKAWIDEGIVNGTGNNRVVVLDMNAATAYNAGHIPGAYMVDVTNTPIYQNRKEGPAVDVNMVLDGSHMDHFVDYYGIDAHTTVVFTGSSASFLSATRAYWMFRYWGFPKEKLKLLDGLNTSWSAAYPLTTNVPPAITQSTYSVKSNGSARTDLRASLSEMMGVASTSPANTIILDTRSTTGFVSYNGDLRSTAGVFATSVSDYVVFEGHMKNAQALAYTTLYDATTLQFKSKSDLMTLLATVGIDSPTTTYVHCRTGVIASLPFFVLDAILGWHVVLYDGSWSQWGQMSAVTANGGQLTSTSPWRTDVPELSGLVEYNYPTWPVELLALDGGSCTGTLNLDGTTTYSGSCTITAPDSELPIASGNQVEDADEAYMTTP